MKYFLAAVILIFVLIFPQKYVSAHGSGASFEKVVNNYKIDIGYEPSEVVENQTESFDFDIFDSKTGNDIEFTDVWAQIHRGTATEFATGIHKSSMGGTSLLYTFKNIGDYSLTVRFQNKDAVLAEATFPFKVIKDEFRIQKPVDTSLIMPLLWLSGGVVVGIFASFVASRVRR